METKPTPESDSTDTDARIDAKPPRADRLNDTVEIVAATLVADATGYNGRSRFFEGESDRSGDGLNGFVADVTTIAQSQCERWESHANIETLICNFPIDHLTFAVHDSSAPYTGPYPMVIYVRATLLMEINGRDETALHDYLRAIRLSAEVWDLRRF